MLDAVQVPHASIIDKWDKIDDLPIVETVPRSVPLSIFVRYPSEGQMEHLISTRANKITNSKEADQNYIEIIENTIAMIDKFLADFYTYRGITKPYFGHLEKIKQSRGITETPKEFTTAEAGQCAKKLMAPLMRMLRSEKDSCVGWSYQIQIFFKDSNLWKEGRYNDDFLDVLCLMFHKILALDSFPCTKQGVTNDLTKFKAMQNDKKTTEDLSNLLIWLLSRNSVTNALLKDLTIVPPEDSIMIFDIVFKHIKKNIENPDFVIPDMQFAYRSCLTFMVLFYDSQANHESQVNSKNKKAKNKMKELSQSIREFIVQVITLYPLTPMYFEYSIITDDYLPNNYKTLGDRKSSSQCVLKLETFEKQLDDLSMNFTKLTHILSNVTNDPSIKVDCGPSMCNVLLNLLHLSANALNDIRTLISTQLIRPPPETPKTQGMTTFERSMKEGLKNHVNMILLLLKIIRSTKELIQTNLPLIHECVSAYIQSYIQLFVWDKLKEILNRNSQAKKALAPTISVMRTIAGCFTEEEYNYDEKKDKKKQPPRPPKLTSGPSLDVLAHLRHQLQLMVNPESPFIARSGFSGSVLSSSDIKDITTFVESTRYFPQLLCLSETIEIVCDQSNLYFKEFFLNTNQVSFFPVTTSLPVILSDHVLKNHMQPELTGAIFYPLSIYDDAASKALRYLHSKYLYEEIKAEANICLMSITRAISDSVFFPIRTFASIRCLPQQFYNIFRKHLKSHDIIDNVSTVRMGVLLQQNQLFVLGCYIETKTLLAERLNDIFNEQIQDILGNVAKFGVITSVAVSKLLEMLRYTHAQFFKFGLPIMPFEDLLSHALCNDTPNSFQSQLLIEVCEHILGHIGDFQVMTHPLIMVPRFHPQIDLRGPEVYLQLMSMILNRTMNFISVENFRELFWLLENGAIAMMHGQILNIVDEIFDEFKSLYASVRSRLKRIRDGRNMNCQQIYNRYEGAYRYFAEDKEILELLKIMAELGNVLALSELMDNALLMKRGTMIQNQGFIYGQLANMDDPPQSPEFFGLFDKEFQDTRNLFLKPGEKLVPNQNEIVPQFLSMAVTKIASLVTKSGIFNETSQNIVELTSLTGFGAVWSIIEFLFCILDLINDDQKGENALRIFGEGPLLTAAAVLIASGQKTLYRVFCIGERVLSTMSEDTTFDSTSRVKEFADIYKFVSSTMQCYLANYQSAMEQSMHT